MHSPFSVVMCVCLSLSPRTTRGPGENHTPSCVFYIIAKRLHAFVWDECRWRREYVNGFLFTEITSFPNTPTSCGRELLNTSTRPGFGSTLSFGTTQSFQKPNSVWHSYCTLERELQIDTFDTFDFFFCLFQLLATSLGNKDSTTTTTCLQHSSHQPQNTYYFLPLTQETQHLRLQFLPFSN